MTRAVLLFLSLLPHSERSGPEQRSSLPAAAELVESLNENARRIRSLACEVVLEARQAGASGVVGGELAYNADFRGG